MDPVIFRSKVVDAKFAGRGRWTRTRRMRDMSCKMIATSLITLSAAGLLSVTLAHAGANVSVGVNVGVPLPPPPVVVVAPPVVVAPAPPPPVVIGPPPIVVIPGSPVYYAPGADFNLFVYGGRQYRFHEGNWFIATSSGGPWTFVARERVPQPVLAVPVTYYRIPPGHAKKMRGPDMDDHGPKGRKGKHN
jgi:hypothetical protein